MNWAAFGKTDVKVKTTVYTLFVIHCFIKSDDQGSILILNTKALPALIRDKWKEGKTAIKNVVQLTCSMSRTELLFWNQK